MTNSGNKNPFSFHSGIPAQEQQGDSKAFAYGVLDRLTKVERNVEKACGFKSGNIPLENALAVLNKSIMAINAALKTPTASASVSPDLDKLESRSNGMGGSFGG